MLMLSGAGIRAAVQERHEGKGDGQARAGQQTQSQRLTESPSGVHLPIRKRINSIRKPPKSSTHQQIQAFLVQVILMNEKNK